LEMGAHILFARAGLEPRSPNLSLPGSWDCRCEPPAAPGLFSNSGNISFLPVFPLPLSFLPSFSPTLQFLKHFLSLFSFFKFF
jgi:hypothetical protein